MPVRSRMFTILAVLTIAAVGCSSDSTAPEEQVGCNEPIPGAIDIAVENGPSKAEFMEFVDKLGLAVEGINFEQDFPVWFEIEHEDFDPILLESFRQDPNVSIARGWGAGYPMHEGWDKTKMHVQLFFRPTADDDYVKNLIEAMIENVLLIEIDWRRRSALLRVPEGTEDDWVEALPTFAIVRHASRPHVHCN